MKRIIYLLLLTLLFSCEKPSECIESTGEIVTRDVPISAFTRLEVYRGIAVQITEGANYSLQIKSGENLIDNVEVKQEGQILKLKDNTSCNWLREYGQTTIYITAPNIEEIYSKTERDNYFPLLASAIYFSRAIVIEGVSGVGARISIRNPCSKASF
jgi:hypothetical protein